MGRKKMNHHNITLNNLIQQKVCPVCGKAFCLQVGTTIDQYSYKLNVSTTKTKIYAYYCSWTCYRKAKIEIIKNRKKVTEGDRKWLKWAKAI